MTPTNLDSERVAAILGRLAAQTSRLNPSVSEIARAIADLLGEFRIFGYQQIGAELCRRAVTAGIEGQPLNPKLFT